MDVYDALTTEKPYKRAFPPDQAVCELREEAAKGWKFEAIVEEFVTLATQGDVAQLSLADTRSAPRVQQWRTAI